MSRPVISVSGLSKRYTIQHESQNDTLRDALRHGARRIWRRYRWGTGFTTEDFWALRDVSFDVKQGEVLGIIGRNGAGKSTLLKILSRITEPTTGKISLRGRVASLLEVGTGFHPELSGRENIFLNGAILGMSRAEIRSKFDAIVAFAEIEKFLDTPVKRYSSGMYVRLAFAVAAHLEPEILIVDEVLAVGDAQFQQKCLGKLQDVARGQGRTVLFVSHNLSIIQSICQSGILLKAGQIAFNGPAHQAVAKYLETNSTNIWRAKGRVRQPCGIYRIAAEFSVPGRIEIETDIVTTQPQKLALEIFLHDAFGQPIGMGGLGNITSGQLLDLAQGRFTVRCALPIGNLANGTYILSCKLVVPFISVLDEVRDALRFDVELPPPEGSSHRLVQNWGAGSCMLALQHLSTTAAAVELESPDRPESIRP